MVAFSPVDGQHVRPTASRSVPAPAFDALSAAERTDYLETHPLSYSLVTRSPGDGGPKDSASLDDLISMGAQALERIVDADAFAPPHDDVFFLYRLTSGTHSQLGIVGLLDVADYDAGRIKPHEQVSDSRALHLSQHFEHLGVQSSPIVVSYRRNPAVSQLLVDLLERLEPSLSFTSGDGVHQEVWVVNASADREAVTTALQFDSVYIIDGHHRAAAAATLRRRSPSEGNRRMLGVAFAEDDINIDPFHRRIAFHPDDDRDLMHEKLTELLALEPVAHHNDAQPASPGQVGVWSKAQWWTGTLQVQRAAGEAAGIDAIRLQEDVLSPVFGSVAELDGRLGYFQNDADLDLLSESVGGTEVLFLLRAADIRQVFALADSGGVMPPKSTYVTPKPRSGVFLRHLS